MNVRLRMYKDAIGLWQQNNDNLTEFNGGFW